MSEHQSEFKTEYDKLRLQKIITVMKRSPDKKELARSAHNITETI